MAQSRSLTFERTILNCPACDREIKGTFLIQFGSDAVVPIDRVSADSGNSTERRFEITGNLAGIRLEPHICGPLADDLRVATREKTSAREVVR